MMDLERKINPLEVFSVEVIEILPTTIDDLKVSFNFKLGANETIHDIFLRGPCGHRYGSFYGDGNLLINCPAEFNYALALYEMSSSAFDVYTKMTGQDLCNKCQCDITEDKVLYLPLSTDRLFRVMIEEWCRRYKEFQAAFEMTRNFPAGSVKLYIKKIIKMEKDQDFHKEVKLVEKIVDDRGPGLAEIKSSYWSMNALK